MAQSQMTVKGWKQQKHFMHHSKHKKLNGFQVEFDKLVKGAG